MNWGDPRVLSGEWDPTDKKVWKNPNVWNNFLKAQNNVLPDTGSGWEAIFKGIANLPNMIYGIFDLAYSKKKQKVKAEWWTEYLSKLSTKLDGFNEKNEGKGVSSRDLISIFIILNNLFSEQQYRVAGPFRIDPHKLIFLTLKV